MSNKRAASSELNHDNWNMEEEPEEMGTYKRASPSSLKIRPMKKARRRGGAGESEGPSVFKNFKAFGTADSSAIPSFSFLSNDGEKPKLSIGGSFPSFSFGKSADANKVDDTKSLDSQSSEKSVSGFGSTLSTIKNNDKGEKESSSKPVFEFSVTDTNKNTTVIESSKSPYSFGVPAANKNTDKPISSGFSFGPSKKESTDKSEIEISSKPIFKFGVTDTSKSSEPIESPPKPTFSFGVHGSNENGDKPVLSKFNFNPSKPGGEASPLFKFGVNNNSSTPSVTPQHSKQSSDSTGGESSSYSHDTKSKEPQASKFNGIKETPKTEKKKSTLFLANLKALNLGVMKWVQQHLDKNQCINLIPIFEDYKSHFEDIKRKFDNEDTQQTKCNKISSSNQMKESSSTSNINSSTDRSPLTFGSFSTAGRKVDASPSGSLDEQKQNVVEEEKSISDKKPFTFGVNKPSEKSVTNSDSTTKSSGLVFNFAKSNSNPAFSFGSDNKSTSSFNFGSVDNSSTSKTSGFSFGISNDKTSGFSFATASESKPPQESKDDENKVEEHGKDEQMPEIKEDDAVYEKKVKLFHKVGSKYDSFGVGTLYIKLVKEKSQLLVRADNSLGTVLLNIVLNDSIPAQRVGKNNVLIACVPNPPIATCKDPKAPATYKDPKAPASILIRVKEEKDADELLEKFNHYKKSQLCDDDTGKETD